MEISPGYGKVKEVPILNKKLLKEIEELEQTKISKSQEPLKDRETLEEESSLEEIENLQDWKIYEEAYQKIKEQDTPDLWGRIEVGIEKEISAKKKTKRFSKKTIATYSSLAAAVLVCFITIAMASQVFQTENQEHSVTESNSQQIEGVLPNHMAVEGDTINEEESTDMIEFAEQELPAKESINETEIENTEKKTSGKNVENTEEIEDENNQSNSERTEAALNITLKKEKNKDLTGLKIISFKDLKKDTKNIVKEEIENYNQYTYYLDNNNRQIYMKMGETVYHIIGGSVKE